MNNNDFVKIDPVIIENMEYPLPKQPNRFFQMLSNAGDKIGDVGSALKNRVSDIILGQEIEEPKTIITDEGIQSGINNGGRRGGLASFLGDVTQGTRENMANSFEPTNLLPNKNKGFGYRLGEALGTGARLLDNSLVRGALAYGLSKYNGDYNPLEQGLIALGTNMQNKTNDRLYRNQLEGQGIDTSNIRGFITDDVYKNIALNNYRNNSLALKSNIANAKDNTTRAKMIGDWLKNGQLSPEDAKVLIAQYGLTNADFQLSNETRKADSQIALNTQRGEKLESDINVNNAILGGADVVRVIAPNGQIGTIPSENLENALKAGYKRL